jgi:hypothetical protein
MTAKLLLERLRETQARVAAFHHSGDERGLGIATRDQLPFRLGQSMPREPGPRRIDPKDCLTLSVDC